MILKMMKKSDILNQLVITVL